MKSSMQRSINALRRRENEMVKRNWKLTAKALLVTGLLVSTSAFAAGLYTNGLPTVGAPTANGTAMVAPNGIVTQLTSRMLMGVDTQLARGAAPQTVGASVFDVASMAGEIAASTATSTTHAATLNTLGGTITTEALSTAAGATYTFTLTNSLVTLAGSPVQVAMRSISNTGGSVQLQSVTNAAGSVVFVFKNVGATAFNGTMVISFHV